MSYVEGTSPLPVLSRAVRGVAVGACVALLLAWIEAGRLLGGASEANGADWLGLAAAGVTVLLPAALLLGGLAGFTLGAQGIERSLLAWLPRHVRRGLTARASTVVGVVVGATAGLAVAFVGFRLALGSELGGGPWGSPALGVAVVAVLWPGVAVCCAIGSASLARRLLGAADERALVRLLVWATVGAALGAVSAEVLRRLGPVLGSLDGRMPAAVALGLLLWLGLDLLVDGTPRVVRTALAGVLALCLGAGSAWGLYGLDTAPAAQEALGTDRGLLGLLVPRGQGLLDRDGDGYSAWLGGGDCREGDPRVHPGADDLPGNGIDEDCDGEDLALPPAPPPAAVAPPPAPPQGPRARLLARHNIVLISIDTLRADHVGCYGYERDITPNVDRLAERSVRFSRAYSLSNKTPSVIGSLVTGRYPSEHPRTFAHFNRFLPANVFLAERLAAADFRTSAVMSHWYFEPKFGIGQGFQTWEVVKDTRERMEKVPSAHEVADKAIVALRELRSRPGPYHLWLHFIDPHKLYIPHPELPSLGRRAVDRYDGEIQFSDLHLGRFLEELYAGPDWDQTVVVLISDHGEAFGEHGEWHHGWSLHEHQLRVPFLLRVPGLDPSVSETRVSLIDLVPTLLDLAGLPPDGGETPVRGVSLLPALLSGGEWAARPIYAEVYPGPHNAAWSMFIEGDLKLIHRWRGNVFVLHDLAEDPGELVNLYRRPGGAGARLKARYQAWRSANVQRFDPPRR